MAYSPHLLCKLCIRDDDKGFGSKAEAENFAIDGEELVQRQEDWLSHNFSYVPCGFWHHFPVGCTLLSPCLGQSQRDATPCTYAALVILTPVYVSVLQQDLRSRAVLFRDLQASHEHACCQA